MAAYSRAVLFSEQRQYCSSKPVITIYWGIVLIHDPFLNPSLIPNSTQNQITQFGDSLSSEQNQNLSPQVKIWLLLQLLLRERREALPSGHPFSLRNSVSLGVSQCSMKARTSQRHLASVSFVLPHNSTTRDRSLKYLRKRRGRQRQTRVGEGDSGDQGSLWGRKLISPRRDGSEPRPLFSPPADLAFINLWGLSSPRGEKDTEPNPSSLLCFRNVVATASLPLEQHFSDLVLLTGGVAPLRAIRKWIPWAL